MISNADIKLAVIAQTAATTMPTTGTLLGVDHVLGSLELYKESERVESNTVKPNRAKAVDRRGKDRVMGSFKFRIHKDAAFELFLSSLLGNSWTDVAPTGDANDTLISGVKRVPFALVVTYVDETGAITRDQALGCEVTKLTFDAENSAGLEATVEFIAVDLTEGLSGASTLTAQAANSSLELLGDEVVNITISGVSLTDYTKLSFSIEQPRDHVHVLGSTLAKGIMASATRNISGSVNYLKPTGATPAFTGAGQAFSFGLGGFYLISTPTVTVQRPKNDYGANVLESQADVSAGYDNTAATDIMITRLS